MAGNVCVYDGENEIYGISGCWLCGFAGDEILLIFTFIFIVGARINLQFSHSVSNRRFLLFLFPFFFHSHLNHNFEFEMLPLNLYEFVFYNHKTSKTMVMNLILLSTSLNKIENDMMFWIKPFMNSSINQRMPTKNALNSFNFWFNGNKIIFVGVLEIFCRNLWHSKQWFGSTMWQMLLSYSMPGLIDFEFIDYYGRLFIHFLSAIWIYFIKNTKKKHTKYEKKQASILRSATWWCWIRNCY